MTLGIYRGNINILKNHNKKEWESGWVILWTFRSNGIFFVGEAGFSNQRLNMLVWLWCRPVLEAWSTHIPMNWSWWMCPESNAKTSKNTRILARMLWMSITITYYNMLNMFRCGSDNTKRSWTTDKHQSFQELTVSDLDNVILLKY